MKKNEYRIQNPSLVFFKKELNTNAVDDLTVSVFELPENNFLKDHNQIEKEFKEEVDKLNEKRKGSEYYFLLDGELVEAGQVLSRQMEENY